MEYNKFTAIEPKEPKVIGECMQCGEEIYEGQSMIRSKSFVKYTDYFCNMDCLLESQDLEVV